MLSTAPSPTILVASIMIWPKYKAPDIVNVIKIRRLEWLGHVVRMNETRSVKIFEGKLEG
jgi:hypothetical protein